MSCFIAPASSGFNPEDNEAASSIRNVRGRFVPCSSSHRNFDWKSPSSQSYIGFVISEFRLLAWQPGGVDTRGYDTRKLRLDSTMIPGYYDVDSIFVIGWKRLGTVICGRRVPKSEVPPSQGN